MSKKVIGALLALALVLSVFSFSVFAAGTGYDNDPDHIQTWRLSAIEAGSGGTYTVKVYLTTTYEVGPIQFKIDGVDEVTDVQLGADYYENAQVSPSKSGFVIITPNTSAPVTVKKLTDAHVATVTYTSEPNATPTMDENDYKSASNPNGKLAAIYAEGSQYLNACNLLTGQKAKVIPVGGEAPTPPPATEAADLQVKSGVVIDTHKTFGGAYDGAVYGIPFKADGTALKEADYENYLTATNGGSLVYVKTPYVTRPASYGTGTTVQVKNSDGTVAKTYVIVIFGDVDGSGALAAKDIQLGVSEVMNPTLTEVQKLAANCYGLPRGSQTNIIDSYYTIDAGDLKAMCTQVMSGNGYDFVTLAEKHALYNTYYQ